MGAVEAVELDVPAVGRTATVEEHGHVGVIVQVRPHPVPGEDGGDAVATELVLRAHPGQHQEPRRLEGPGTHRDLAADLDPARRPPALVLDGRGPAPLVEHDAMDPGVGLDAEIGPVHPGREQRHVGAPTFLAPVVHPLVAEPAGDVAVVQVLRSREALSLRGLDARLGERGGLATMGIELGLERLEVRGPRRTSPSPSPRRRPSRGRSPGCRPWRSRCRSPPCRAPSRCRAGDRRSRAGGC